MCRLKNKKEVLAIIGNGFDLAHEYQTGYPSFVEKVRDPALSEFRKFCDESKIKTWYHLEDSINDLTNEFFMQSYSEDGNEEENRNKTTYLRKIFTRIQYLLAGYLREEINSKPLVKKASVSKYLNSNTTAICFNYTDTAEKYIDNIFYVHGSLKEDDILLGYDYRPEGCLAEFNDMCWGKIICREALEFRRMLRRELRLNSEEVRFNELCNSLELYQSCELSGRGIDDEVERSIPNYTFVKTFIDNYREHHTIPNIDYKAIKTIVVLGHGIEADKVYLDSIIKECTNLKQIVLFTFENESKDDLDRKIKFLEDYCPTIDIVKY